MNIELEQKSPTDALIKITLNEADYQPEVEKKIKQYSKQIHLKGFRPGKVPPAIIKRMYGKSILIEEINRMLSHSVYDYIVSEKLSVVGDPLPDESAIHEIDWDNQKDFQFVYQIGVVPKFEYNLQNIVVTAYEITQDDAQLEEVINNLRRQFGETTHPEVTEKGDFLYGNFKQLSSEETSEEVGEVKETTEEIEESEAEQTESELFEKLILLPLNQVNEDLVDRFVGLSINDVVDVEIQELFKSGAKGINLATGIPLDEAENLQGVFEFTLIDITRTQAADFDTEFFSKVFPNEGILDEAAFQEKVKTIIHVNYQRDSDYLLDTEIKKELLKQTDIHLPDEFLKNWLTHINEEKFTREQIEDEYEDFAENLRWDLIRNKLTEDLDIEVSQEEIEARTLDLFKMQFGGYMPADLEFSNRMQAVIDNYLKLENGKNYQRIYKEVSENKVFEKLRNEVDKTVMEVSAEEFEKIMES